VSAVYTVQDIQALRYTIVAIDDHPAPVDLPAPSKIPQVAREQIPDRHAGPTSPGEDYQILVRRRGEACPFAGTDVECEWINRDEVAEHKRKNRDVWESEES